jgi:hypothetical protein
MLRKSIRFDSGETVVRFHVGILSEVKLRRKMAIHLTSVGTDGTWEIEDFEDLEALERELKRSATLEYTNSVLEGLRLFETVTVPNGDLLTDIYTII